MAQLAPWQQRVVDERRDLGYKVVKLAEFIITGTEFTKLDPAEQERLRKQERAMEDYAHILDERIAAFTK